MYIIYVNDKQSDKRRGGVGKRVGEVDLSDLPPKYFAYLLALLWHKRLCLHFIYLMH